MVSIVVASYNYERYIAQTIKSMQAQTYPHWELWVVDDGSTDQTAAVVKPFTEQDSRVHYVYQQNAGKCTARNKGASLAQYPLLAFCDADDQWIPNKLELQLQMMEQRQADVVFTAYQMIDENSKPGKVVVKQPRMFEGMDGMRAMFDSNPVLFSSVLLKRSFFEQVGGFMDIKSPSAEDYHLWLRLAVAGARFYRSEAVTVWYRRHERQSSAKDFGVTPWALYVFRHLPTPTPTIEQLKKEYLKKWYHKLLNIKPAENRSQWRQLMHQYQQDTKDGFTYLAGVVSGTLLPLGLAQKFILNWLKWQTRGIEKYNAKQRALLGKLPPQTAPDALPFA